MEFNKYRQMRLILIYDMPMKDLDDQKIYEHFHKKLIYLGYHMLQYSVYTKSIQNEDNFYQMESITKKIIPQKGQIIIFKVTEKQYNDFIYLNGEKNKYDTIVGNKELVIFGDDENE